MTTEKRDPKTAALLKECKKLACEKIEDEFDRMMRCYGEAMQEHERNADEGAKKMVYPVGIALRFTDTDGNTRPDVKITYGLKFSSYGVGQSISGHPEFDFSGAVGGDAPPARDEGAA